MFLLVLFWWAWFFRCWVKWIRGWLTVECGSLSSSEDKFRRESALTGYAEVFQLIANQLSGILEKIHTCSLLCLSWTTLQREKFCFWHEALYSGEIYSMFSLIWIPRWLSHWTTWCHWSVLTLSYTEINVFFPRTRCYLEKSI